MLSLVIFGVSFPSRQSNNQAESKLSKYLRMFQVGKRREGGGGGALLDCSKSTAEAALPCSPCFPCFGRNSSLDAFAYWPKFAMAPTPFNVVVPGPWLWWLGERNPEKSFSVRHWTGVARREV